MEQNIFLDWKQFDAAQHQHRRRSGAIPVRKLDLTQQRDQTHTDSLVALDHFIDLRCLRISVAG
jgi:hypothetical protein